MIRNWRERWDPNAEFVFATHLNMGLAELPTVMPGDPVPRELFEEHRLRRWFDAGVIKLAPTQNVGKATIVRLTDTVWEVRVPGQEAQRVVSASEGRRLLEQMTVSANEAVTAVIERNADAVREAVAPTTDAVAILSRDDTPEMRAAIEKEKKVLKAAEKKRARKDS